MLLNKLNNKKGINNGESCGFVSWILDLEDMLSLCRGRLIWLQFDHGDSSSGDVLAIKPGEMRIGLDSGIGTRTFAARMREHNVTVVSTALNLRAPFNEMIALRGLVPLFITLNQRLPFFHNTMDMVHIAGFLDGWIDLQLLDFILFDWGRILKPGGLLRIDRFFCVRKDLDDFMYMFLQLRYKKHKWAISPKSKDEVYFSALLEKPPRAI